ncbi:MAG: signal peptidase I [Clostridia bacterium]|nr:signal peptidase I [Clostridia bacterium]
MNILKKIQSRLKIRLISGFSTLLLIIAVASCLFFTLQSLSTGYVSFFGTSVFRVVTGSMEPEIPVGALLTSKQVEIEEIKENDIICFKSNEFGQGPKIITHRVIAIYTNPDGTIALQTKGDANPVVDGALVSEKQLIGLVTNYTGDGSKMAELIRFLTSDFGFLACIILPVILVAVWIFKDAIKNMKEAIVAANKQLEEQEKAGSEPISEQEYTELYKKVEEELRKEMQQNVQNDCGKVNSDAPQLDSEDTKTASTGEN